MSYKLKRNVNVDNYYFRGVLVVCLVRGSPHEI